MVVLVLARASASELGLLGSRDSANKLTLLKLLQVSYAC